MYGLIELTLNDHGKELYQ